MFKEEVKYFSRESGFSRRYGKTNKNELTAIDVYDDHKIVAIGMRVEKSDKKYDYKEEFNYYYGYLNELKHMGIMDCNIINVSEVRYNDIDCYILDETYSDSYSRRIYVDKVKMLMIRYEEISKDGEIEYFMDYKYEVGTVSDDDVKIKDIEGYDIDDNTKKYLGDFIN